MHFVISLATKAAQSMTWLQKLMHFEVANVASPPPSASLFCSITASPNSTRAPPLHLANKLKSNACQTRLSLAFLQPQKNPVLGTHCKMRHRLGRRAIGQDHAMFLQNHRQNQHPFNHRKTRPCAHTGTT